MISESLFIPRSTIAAFAKSKDVLAVLKALKSHSLLSRVQYSAVEGGIDEITNMYPTGGTPDLLIIEHDASMDELDRLAEVSGSNTQLIVISRDNDISRYRQLLDQGGADYLFTPITPELLLGSISRTFARSENRQVGTLLTVFSCGRGSGGSTIAQNTAALLAQLPDKRAMLLDFDMYTGTATLNFDLNPVRGLRELLRDPKSITPKEISKLTHERSVDLQILCSAPTLEAEVSLSSDHFVDIIDQARTLVDFVVIDMPTGWSLLHSKLLAMSERALLVTMTDLGSYQTLRNVETMAGKLRQSLPPADVILNRWTPASEKLLSAQIFAETAQNGRLVKVGDFGQSAIAAAENVKLVAELEPNHATLGELKSFLSDLAGARTPDVKERGSPLLTRLLRRGRK
jgi:pilus assembly protein CpaE